MRLDRRGTAAFEFTMVAAAFFLFLFGIIDMGRYLITVQSLRALAGAGAREIQMNPCYVNNVLKKLPPAGCPTDPLSAAEKEAVAPFLFNGGLTPTLSVSTGSSPITVTASQPDFTMIYSWLWGSSFNAPTATTPIPY